MAKEAFQADVDDSVDADGEGIEQDQYLVFTSMAQEYGIQAMRVREISAMIEITKVPKAPPYIEGILNLRGRLVSIVNFRKKFGFEAKSLDEDTRIIIVEHLNFPIGIMVDKVEEVIRIPDENVQNLPETSTTDTSAEYLTGVGLIDSRLVILLDADQLFKADLLDAEAIRRVAAEALSSKLPEPAAGESIEARTHGHREAEPRKKEGR